MSAAGRWYTAEISYWAADDEDAENVLDRISVVVCEGTGEGEDHECRRDWVAGLRLLARDHSERSGASSPGAAVRVGGDAEAET